MSVLQRKLGRIARTGGTPEQPASLCKSYGWEVAPPSPKTYGHARLSHSGGINGFGANFIRVPGPRLTAIVLSNNEAIPATVMSEDVLSIYYGQPVKLPVARPVATVARATLDRYAGQYRMPSGVILTISSEGAKLFADVTARRPAICAEAKAIPPSEGR